jgi:hypothetical protein
LPTSAAQSQPVPPIAWGRVPPRLWSIHLNVANVFDSNIDHDERGLDAYGMAGGMGLRFQTSAARPLFRLEYEVAGHLYKHTDRWDRVSHHLSTVIERRLGRRLSIETLGEVSLKGSSEDRELSDQYILEPQVEYRLTRSHKLTLYGAYRLKRYDDSADRDATNRYLGIELRQRASSRGQWEAGYRYETNRSRGLRSRYLRQTYKVEYSHQLTGQDMLALEVKHRRQRYRHRFAEIGDLEVPRQDRRWIPSLSWVHQIAPNIDVRLGYTFETRLSNDPEKNFRAHFTTLSFTRRW